MTAADSGSALALAAQGIETTLDDIFSAADDLRALVESIWADVDDRAITPDDLAKLRPLIGDALDNQPHLSGCGFVAEIDIVEGHHRFWEWWTAGEHGGQPRRLLLRTTDDDNTSYAYESMDWFAHAHEGTRTVVGPYLDFAGADRFVITCTEPVTHDGRFVGITGADVLVSLLEPIFLSHMGPLDQTCVLINRESRIVTSNSPEFAPGERFRTPGENTHPVDSGRADWTLCQLD